MHTKSNCIKKSGPRTTQSLILAASALLLGSSVVKAATPLVNWGGEYVSANIPFAPTSYTSNNGIDLDGDLSNDDSRFGFAYTATASGGSGYLGRNPAPLSPTSGYSGTSGTFYGGMVINTINNPDSSSQVLQPNAQGVHDGTTPQPDHLKFQTQHSGNHHHTFALMTYWDKSDFLNGGAVSPVNLDANVTFSLTTLASSNVEDDAHLHFLIRNSAGQFYTSQAFWGGTGASLLEDGYQGIFPDGGTVNFNPFSLGLGWAPYNPDSLDLQWSHPLTWETPTFNDITGFGFYIDTLAFVGGPSNNSNLEIAAFSVTPEPSRALLALGGLGLSLLRRRRRSPL